MTAADDLPCQELVELVNDYLEGLLDPETRSRFQRHLDGCPPCASYVDQMRQTIALTGRVGATTLSPRARDGLMKTFRDWASSGDATLSRADGQE